MHNTYTSQFGRIETAAFTPAFSLRNPHVQTIVPKFFIKAPRVNMKQERIKTPDNDFVDLAWSMPANPKALVIMFHGLEGSSQSHYIQHLSATLNEHNIAAVLMHFRGCSGETNLTSRAYHSGATFDPEFIIPIIKARYPHLPLCAVGFSLGGNMLLKLMANAHELPIQASVAVSAPLNLAASAQAISKGFSNVYQKHLMRSMKLNVIKKMQSVDMHDILKVSSQEIAEMTTFRQFDNHITSILHGFKNADDYYQQCSAIHDLPKIKAPTLILHAADDPFMNENVIPKADTINANVAYELSQHGGHVGFLSRLHGPHKLWLPTRITAFIEEVL